MDETYREPIEKVGREESLIATGDTIFSIKFGYRNSMYDVEPIEERKNE